MTQVWWGKEAKPNQRARLVTPRGALRPQPELLPASRKAISNEVRARVGSYTPEWTNLRAGDAGVALVRLFGEQVEPVIERINLLPKKALLEFLNITGAQPLPATSAEAVLEFTVSEAAPGSVLVPRGFQVGARPANGVGDLVIFETVSTLYAAPAKLKEMHVQQRSLFSKVDVGKTFLPFGERAIPGSGIYLGLDSGDVVPGPFLSVGIGVAAPAGVPPPVPSGGVAPLPVPPPPALRWEILDGTSYQPAEVVRDETGGLIRSGVVELRLPRSWRPGPPAGLETDPQLRWLRLRIVSGQYGDAPPSLSFIKLNMTRAVAARTIRDEVLEHVPNSDGRRMRLSQTPVVPGSLVLEVDDGGFDSLTDLEEQAPARSRFTPPSVNDQLDAEAQENETQNAAAGAPAQRWEEVSDLSLYGPEAQVYILNPASGEVTFGDGVRGARVPPGFRNVRAVSYRVGGGAAGAVDAGEIKLPLSSASFVTEVSNPLPASGGTDIESQQSAIRRGPQEFRARGRAVTVADYELMALRAEGAQVERAYAVSGFHPSFPGLPIPGVVGVFVVPPDRNEGPPTPDEATLRAVAQYLSRKLAPAGVEVVAAPPRYHRIRVAIGIVIDRTADASLTVRQVLKELDRYLHPLTGGESGEGWPFGGTLQYTALVRRLLANIAGVRAVPRLNFIVDGVRTRGCADFTPAAYALFWPEGHEVIIIESEETQ